MWSWIGGALLLAAVAAWGGLGWYGKAGAERELAEYQLGAAKVITEQLQNNARLEDQGRQIQEDARHEYEGKLQSIEGSWAKDRASLAALRRAPSERLREPAAGNDGSAVPQADATAAGADATTCERRLQEAGDRFDRVVEAAQGVADALQAAERQQAQLSALQKFEGRRAQSGAP